MKKVSLILGLVILSFTLIACNLFKPKTSTTLITTNSTTSQTTSNETTTNITTDYTTIINDEIYLKLNVGQDTVEINGEWIDEGAMFVLNDVEYDMFTISEVDITNIGLYPVKYTYAYQEQTYEITRYVIVVDQTSPAIELNLGVDTIILGSEWIDAGVTITDNSNEEIEAVITGSVDINTIGTYEITYTVTDSSDNESSIIRYVTVIEE